MFRSACHEFPMKANEVDGSVVEELNPDRRLLDGGQAHVSPEHAARGRAEIPGAGAGTLAGQHHSVIGYDGITRLAIMVTPEWEGNVRDQASEALSMIRTILRHQEEPMVLTMQNVFVADAADAPAIRRLFEAYFGEEMPLTIFVVQPPCDGAALAVEAWAISTRKVSVAHLGPHLVTVEHDGLRWVHASAGTLRRAGLTAFQQAEQTFASLDKTLHAVGVPFRDVVRLWLYQGGITEVEDGVERYRELNRGRTDFYRHVEFPSNPLARHANGSGMYPASTGIGTGEHGLVLTALAIQTSRDDVEVLSLENPHQISAFDYPAEYSKKSPKFSRAMAIRIADHVTTWVSGTASIVASETVFAGDIEKQTHQTLENIENLIAGENFSRQGWADAGATLDDLAKVRVYVKRAEDYEKCRAVCEERLGTIPAVYALANVCRPDLLVEIEGVAFSSIQKQSDS